MALSLPPLWDDIPKIYLSKAGLERSYVRALICLLRRSGPSPTLKLITGHQYSSFGLRRGYESPTVIMLHSERIEKLRIEFDDAIMPLFQGFKGCLPNLRFLRVICHVLDTPSIDVFETAPALRQVAVEGNSSDRVLLPWQQITHFEEEGNGKVGRLVLLSSSSLHSLTNLDIRKLHHLDESALLSPYRPTTLPNLRTLKVVINYCGNKDVDFFIESLTIPFVEVMKILYIGPLIPRLVSMFSGSRGPSRLQKLAFCIIPLQTGELSALLKLTSHLVELDIDIPPVGDLLRLIYSEGGVILVPMLQALYIRIPVLTTVAQIEHLDTLAQVRCELGICKDLEDPTMLSLRTGTWTILHTLRVIFDSPESRDSSQKKLNDWSSSFTLEEHETIKILKGFNPDTGSFIKNVLSCVECYEITNKVLRETNLHIKLRDHFIGVLMKLPDEDKLKQRVMDILAKWEQLLLNDFTGGCWAWTSPEWYDYSLVYVSKSKYHDFQMSPDVGLSLVYGLKPYLANWLRPLSNYYYDPWGSKF